MSAGETVEILGTAERIGFCPEFEDFWAFSGGREAVTWGFGFRLRVRERFCRDNSPCTLGVEPR